MSGRDSYAGALGGPGLVIFNTTTGGDQAQSTDEGLSSTLEDRYHNT